MGQYSSEIELTIVWYMNNLVKSILTVLTTVFLSACMSSKSIVAKSVNLSQYEYVSVINDDTYHIPAELMEYEIMLFDAVEKSGLQLISDRRIYELTPQQKQKLLLVKYGVSQTNENATVTVNFIDYMNGRPIASCRGTYGLGISNSSDLKGAIKRVEKQISETFKK